jgi:site-specific recombinase XerD
MKPTDFAKYLTDFFSTYLTSQKHVSKNTIRSYRDTFKLLLQYLQENVKGLRIERITINDLSKERLLSFLSWLEITRECSISTRNQRLAAIHAFFRYVQAEDPTCIAHFQKILAIPIKKTAKPLVEYLIPEAVKLLLEQADKYTRKGRRDLALMSVLYDSGARVQELIDLRIGDVQLEMSATITLTGKGNKTRQVPIMQTTADLLKNYISENNPSVSGCKDHPLFTNNQNHKLTKEGVAYIIAKYSAMAHKISTFVPLKVHVHMLRHSCPSGKPA